MMLTIAMLFGGATAIDGADAVLVPIAQDESTIILPGVDGSGYSDEYINGFLSYIYLTPLMNFMSQRADQVAYCDTSTSRYLTQSGDESVVPQTYYQNQLFYLNSTATCSNPVVRPNTDDLYVIGQFDLSKGPVRIDHPAMYFDAKPGETEPPASYSLQLIDPWTNTFFHVSPWGTGPTSTTEGSIDPLDPGGGNFEAGAYYIYDGNAAYATAFEADPDIPASALIESEYPWVWMLGRIEILNDDLEKTRVLCRKMNSTSYEWVPDKGLVPIDLSDADWPTNPTQIPCLDPGPNAKAGYGVECLDIEQTQDYVMDYLARASDSLRFAPIPSGLVNDFYKSRLDAIGVNLDVGGPLNVVPSLSQDQLGDITAGFIAATNLCIFCGPLCDTADALDSLGFSKDPTRKEWEVPPSSVGNFGQRIVLRAYIAQIGLGADVKTYEYYPTAKSLVQDDRSTPLISVEEDGTKNEYILIMDASIDRFCSDWSLTMYASDKDESTATVVCSSKNASCEDDDANCVVAVGKDQGAIKSESDDGRSCYRILISPDEPDLTSDPTLNWLPSPTGVSDTDNADQNAYFQVTLRIFNAKFAGPNRHIPGYGWQLPCILPVDSGTYPDCSGCEQTGVGCIAAGDAYIPSNYWIPRLDKPGMTCEAVRLKIPDHGEFSCLPIGEGICRDNGGAFGEWRFGIEEVETPPCEVTSKCRIDTETSTFPVLIDPANTRYPITGTTFTNSETGKVCKNGLNEAVRGCNYAGTTHICISENIEDDPNRYSEERPYMFFYDEKSHQYLYQLVCDGIGEEGKLPELKMVNNEDLADATYVNYPVDIVKFKKGATPNKADANELWKMYMDWNGFEDPDTRRIGKLASFIGVAHPKMCREYVSATDKPCWKEDCNDGSVETPEDYERVDCSPVP